MTRRYDKQIGPPDGGDERWAPTDVDGYWVSDQGRVWSSKTGRFRASGATGRHRQYRAMPLATGPGETQMRYVHRLVLEAFIGPCPDDHEAAHLNGNPSDNRLANLAWVTRSENQRHKLLHGTQQRGESVVGSVLTKAAVVEARSAYLAGEPCSSVAARHGRSRAYMQLVINGRRWAHVPGAVQRRG